MYLEGGDQYRGWFHSSLLVGTALRGESPYRECAPMAGRWMARAARCRSRVGNVVDPHDIIKKYGADMLRLWVASVDFTEDVRMSDTILQRMSDAYRKLRNTFRYALGNLDDFNPASDSVPAAEMVEIDLWILAARRGADRASAAPGTTITIFIKRIGPFTISQLPI